MKRLLPVLLAALAAGWMSGAAAQLRTIPEEAKRGTLRHVEQARILIDGKPASLSPGAQIRDTNNRIILPIDVNKTTVVRYITDVNGQVHRAWILSEAEAKASEPKPKPEPKKDPPKDEKKVPKKDTKDVKSK